MSNLKDMGFPEEDVIVALKATGNSQEAAVRYPSQVTSPQKAFLIVLVIMNRNVHHSLASLKTGI